MVEMPLPTTAPAPMAPQLSGRSDSHQPIPQIAIAATIETRVRPGS